MPGYLAKRCAEARLGIAGLLLLNRLMSSTPAVMVARMVTILITHMPTDQLDRKLKATLLLDNKTLQGYKNLETLTQEFSKISQ